jgi:hypothetical protein
MPPRARTLPRFRPQSQRKNAPPAVDRSDIHDPAELSFPHAVDNRSAHVEARTEVGIDDGLPA